MHINPLSPQVPTFDALLQTQVFGRRATSGTSSGSGTEGPPGPAGATGATGPAGPAMVVTPDDPEEPFFIPGPQGPQGQAGTGGAGNTGTATIDFGAFPGASDASVTVTGQTTIGAGSVVQAWIFPADTADHTADEHWIETIKVVAGNVVAGTGFTIYGINTNQLNEPLTTGGGGRAAVTTLGAQNGVSPVPSVGGMGTRIYGTWNVGWVWN